ncbi:hypothetical protein C8Q80DRAFT_232325 [Daedaleopsis nitida]|nr:hypothetical protein C8Q80DRAFT_232325 [Daedaleopsis nitida]
MAAATHFGVLTVICATWVGVCAPGAGKATRTISLSGKKSLWMSRRTLLLVKRRVIQRQLRSLELDVDVQLEPVRDFRFGTLR